MKLSTTLIVSVLFLISLNSYASAGYEKKTKCFVRVVKNLTELKTSSKSALKAATIICTKVEDINQSVRCVRKAIMKYKLLPNQAAILCSGINSENALSTIRCYNKMTQKLKQNRWVAVNLCGNGVVEMTPW